MSRQLGRIGLGHANRMLHRPLARLALRRLAQDPDPMGARLSEALAKAAHDSWSPEESAAFAKVEAVRAAYAAGQPPILPELASSGQLLAWTVSKRPRWARALYAISRASGAARALEYGTCIGISGAYVATALADHDGHLWTIDNHPAHLKQAKRTMGELGLSRRTTLLEGRFEEVAPPLLSKKGPFGLVFKDAAHTGAATLSSFEEALPHLSDGALFVLDDITWSGDMLAAWRRIRKHPDTSFAVDLFNVGIVCVRRQGADNAGAASRSGRTYRIALP